jgi:hypothetical protein
MPQRSRWSPTMVAALAALALVSVTGATSRPKAGADSTKWSATTYEAAASASNRAALAAGRRVKVTGEVVEVSCFLQLGKRGPAHVACGTKCIEHGQPFGIVDKSGALYVLFPEEHHPRRDGEVDLKGRFLPALSHTVTVEGTLTRHGGYRALFVPASAESLRLLDSPIGHGTAR